MPREHDRIDFVAQIDLESASGRREATVRDISTGGCYIDTVVGANQGDPVRFNVIHPNGGSLPFTGEVSHHFEGIGIGVRFTEKTDEQMMFLHRILRK